MQGPAYLSTSVTTITRALQHLRKGVRSSVCTASSCLPGVILNPDTSQLACPRIWTSFCWSHAFELGRPAITPIHTNIQNCRHVIIYITHKLPLAHSKVVGHCKRDIFDGAENFEKSYCQCRRYKRHAFDPWFEKIPWRRKWQPTPVFLPGKLHGQRSLVGYSPWGCRELAILSACTHTHTHTQHETPYRGADLIRRQDSRHLNGTKYYPELRGRGQDVVGAGRCDSELGLEQWEHGIAQEVPSPDSGLPFPSYTHEC